MFAFSTNRTANIGREKKREGDEKQVDKREKHGTGKWREVKSTIDSPGLVS